MRFTKSCFISVLIGIVICQCLCEISGKYDVGFENVHNRVGGHNNTRGGKYNHTQSGVHRGGKHYNMTSNSRYNTPQPTLPTYLHRKSTRQPATTRPSPTVRLPSKTRPPPTVRLTPKRKPPPTTRPPPKKPPSTARSPPKTRPPSTVRLPFNTKPPPTAKSSSKKTPPTPRLPPNTKPSPTIRLSHTTKPLNTLPPITHQPPIHGISPLTSQLPYGIKHNVTGGRRPMNTSTPSTIQPPSKVPPVNTLPPHTSKPPYGTKLNVIVGKPANASVSAGPSVNIVPFQTIKPQYGTEPTITAGKLSDKSLASTVGSYLPWVNISRPSTPRSPYGIGRNITYLPKLPQPPYQPPLISQRAIYFNKTQHHGNSDDFITFLGYLKNITLEAKRKDKPKPVRYQGETIEYQYVVRDYYHGSEEYPKYISVNYTHIKECPKGTTEKWCVPNTYAMCLANGNKMCVAYTMDTVPCGKEFCVISKFPCGYTRRYPWCTDQHGVYLYIPCMSEVKVLASSTDPFFNEVALSPFSLCAVKVIELHKLASPVGVLANWAINLGNRHLDTLLNYTYH